MAIQISENGRLFTLHTKNSSYQMFADPFGTLLHLYYGKRTDGENLSDLIFRTDMGFSGNPPEAGGDRTYSLDYLPQELPSRCRRAPIPFPACPPFMIRTAKRAKP